MEPQWSGGMRGDSVGDPINVTVSDRLTLLASICVDDLESCDDVSDAVMGGEGAAENRGRDGWEESDSACEGDGVAGAETPGRPEPQVGPLGSPLGDTVHAGKKRANVFSLPVENDSERRASPPGRREPDSAVSEDDLSQMLKS